MGRKDVHWVRCNVERYNLTRKYKGRVSKWAETRPYEERWSRNQLTHKTGAACKDTHNRSSGWDADSCNHYKGMLISGQ